MNEEHYLKKIERNTNALDKAPETVKMECIKNLNWARNLSSRLELLDYKEREIAIATIHSVLDEDYQKMGFEIEEPVNVARSR